MGKDDRGPKVRRRPRGVSGFRWSRDTAITYPAAQRMLQSYRDAYPGMIALHDEIATRLRDETDRLVETSLFLPPKP